MATNILQQDDKQNLLSACSKAARKAKSVVRLRGLLWFFAATLILAFSLLLADGWLQPEGWFIRWSAFFFLIFVSCLLLLRWVVPAFRFSPTPFDVARWMEQAHPEQSKGLVSALELTQMDPQDRRFGSPSFREFAFQQWREKDGIVISQLGNRVRWSALRAAWLSSLLAFSLTLMFAIGQPELFGYAAKRLIQPWNQYQWPKKDQLQIVNLPKAVGHGTALELEIVDLRPPLPEDISIQVRQTWDADRTSVAIPARYEDQRAWVNLPPLVREVQLRAVGGVDRSPPWESIKVVDLPEWKETQFEVVLPGYLSSLEWIDGGIEPVLDSQPGSYVVSGRSVQVVKGSSVRFRGFLNQPVLAVEPIVQTSQAVGRFNSENVVVDHSSADRNLPPEWIVRLDDTGRKLALEGPDGEAVVIPQSTEWRFRFFMEGDIDLDSLSTWRIDVVADEPPEALLEAAEINSLAVGAPLTVSGIASDDWRLKQVAVKAVIESHPDVEHQWLISLGRDDREFRVQSELDLVDAFDSRNVQIQPGDQVLVWLEAKDDLDQVGKSSVFSWNIETVERLVELIAERKSALAKQLRELAELQATGQELTQQTMDSLDNQPPQQGEIDTLSAIVQLQKQIHRQIHEDSDGLSQQIAGSLEQLAQNRLSETDLSRDLQQMQRTLGTAGQSVFDEAWRDSIRSHAMLEDSVMQGDMAVKAQTAIEDLQISQRKASGALKELVEQISSRESLFQYRQQLERFAEQQQNILAETSELHFDQLQTRSAAGQPGLGEMSNQQLSLASDLEQWFLKVQQTLHEEAQEGEGSMQPLEQAVKVFAEQQSVALMKDAGRNIQIRQLSQAMDLQQQVIRDFQQVLSRMAPEKTDEKIQQSDPDTSSSMADDTIDQAQPLQDLQQRLQQIIERQQSLSPRYKAIAEGWRTKEASSESLTEPVEDLLEQQSSIRQQVDALADSVEFPVFQWSLTMVGADLGKAVAATRRKRIDPEAILATDDAVRKLLAIQSAAEPTPLTEEDDEDNDVASGETRETADSPAQSQSDQADSKSAGIASLRLIRALQDDLKQQTLQLDSISDRALRSNRITNLQQSQFQLLEHLEQLIEIWGSDRQENLDTSR